MIILYKYIFYKIFHFYISFFKEKEIPHWFASTITLLILLSNVIAIINAFLLLFYPEVIFMIDVYFKYLALLFLFVTIRYVSYKKRYLSFINEVEKLPKKRKLRLSYISVFYVITVLACYFMMNNLIREYNLIVSLR